MAMRSGKGLAAVVVAGAMAGACGESGVPFESQQSGSVGIDAKSGLLYAADLDNGGVLVVDPKGPSRQTARFVPTGTRPERVLVANGQIWVANRFSRTVTQVDGASLQVVRQIATGAEPMGMRLSKDGSTLLVAAAMSGSVQAFNATDGAKKWEAKLGDEVRAVGVLPDGKIYAPGFKSGTMHVVDGDSGAQLDSFSFAQPADPSAKFNRRATMAQDVVVTDDGRVFVPHSQTQQDPLAPVTTGYYAIGPGPAVSPGITTVDDGRVRVDAKSTFGSDTEANYPPTMFLPTESFSGPMVAALDASGAFLYVVNHWSNNVAVVSTNRTSFGSSPGFGTSLGEQGVSQLVPVGRGPTGIAIAKDQTEAYVYNSFDHTVTVLGQAPDGGIMAVREIRGTDDADGGLTKQTLSAKQRLGRNLFNDASDDRLTLTSAGGVACASCHPDGREDGNNWQFAEGTRNTPLLAGKHLKQTKPYHWDGQFDEFSAFQHVLQKRMGGSGIGRDEFDAILEFLDNEPGPDNPNVAPGGTLTAEQQHGKELFQGKAACTACHTGDILTDNKFWDVGTHLESIDIALDGTSFVSPSDRKPALPNTPSLIGIFATAPYLHDGSKVTLEERLKDNPNDIHGRTSDLSDADVHALAEYLKTL